MTTGLGYGSGLIFRQTIRNNSATVDIPTGTVVSLVTTGIGTIGADNEAVLLGVASAAAPDAKALGVAERDILQGTGTATGEGEWGHVVAYGLVKYKASAVNIVAGDALAVKSDGTLMKATDAQIDAGEGVGVALEAIDVSVNPLGYGFVDFIHRSTASSAAGGSGFGGAST